MAFTKTIRSSHLPTHPKEDHWIPLSDLMTGLMMVFMLVAIAFMIQVEAESEKVKQLMRRASSKQRR